MEVAEVVANTGDEELNRNWIAFIDYVKKLEGNQNMTAEFLRRYGLCKDARVSSTYATVMEYDYEYKGKLYRIYETKHNDTCVVKLPDSLNVKFGGF